MRLAFILFAGIFLAACTAEESDKSAAEDTGAVEATSADPARIMDGIQVVEIEAGARGFHPQFVHLRANVPARLIFKRTTEAECLHHISVPEFGVEKRALPMHEEVAVEFRPAQDGQFTFVCGMGMQKGTLVVSG